jgi:DNA-binding NarL/FixJ family response regulator
MEAAVLTEVAAGLSDKEIGERLSMTTGTVHTHLTRAIKKLGASGRLDAAERAIAAGLIQRPNPRS